MQDHSCLYAFTISIMYAEYVLHVVFNISKIIAVIHILVHVQLAPSWFIFTPARRCSKGLSDLVDRQYACMYVCRYSYMISFSFLRIQR